MIVFTVRVRRPKRARTLTDTWLVCGTFSRPVTVTARRSALAVAEPIERPGSILGPTGPRKRLIVHVVVRDGSLLPTSSVSQTVSVVTPNHTGSVTPVGLIGCDRRRHPMLSQIVAAALPSLGSDGSCQRSPTVSPAVLICCGVSGTGAAGAVLSTR